MERRAEHRRVLQFHAVARVPQQQTATAHIAAPDERDRELQAAAEDAGQDIDVLRRGDAAQQDDVALGSDFRKQCVRAGLERTPVPGIVRVDVAFRERLHRGTRHQGVGASQPGVRRDDVDAVADDRVVRLGRPREPPRVGQLAAKVQAADEAEEIAEGGARLRAQRRRERELRIRRQCLLGTGPREVRGRQEKNARRHLR
jgi:hypothetical protein